MKIKMLATRKGCEDGHTIKEYHANNEYELRDHLAIAFMAAGFAIPVEEYKRQIKQGKRPYVRPKRYGEIVYSPRPNSNLEKLKLEKLRISNDK